MIEQALKALFERRFGERATKVAPLKGDASARTLYRIWGGKRTAIGAVNADRKENEAFLGFSRHFRRRGLPVPEIYAEDLKSGFYLEEDLGDTTLFQFLSKNRTDGRIAPAVVTAYRSAVRMLPRFQITAGKSLDYRLCYPRSSFDQQSMMWDLNYFKYYFLRLSRVPFDEQGLENDFERFTRFLLKADRNFFLYRDFQSRNIMIRRGRPWFIDYQGGRKGALQYDIASLLYDAKADLPAEFREELLREYLQAASKLARIDRGEFMEFFPGFVYIRILQAMGAYGLRGFYERKSHFLQSIPYAIRNIEYLLRTTKLPIELPALMSVFRRMVASSALRQFGDAELGLTVRVQSFSYHGGMPADEKGHGGGFVFDCRALPNPGRQHRYAKLTGNDAPVIAYLSKSPEVRRFLSHSFKLVDQAVDNYRKRNFTDLLVTFGCTGGRHRSVYCAERLARHLREKFQVRAEVRHNELEKGVGR